MFGNLKIEWNCFTNCGVRHTQDKTTKECHLDQLEYAKNLRTISHPEVSSSSPESACGPELIQLYQSLLGAVAYLYLTRLDILVFISACQRQAHAPLIIHVKRLNVIVRWVQRNPVRLYYRNFPPGPVHLKVVSDAAFKKEEEKGHSLRGSLYLVASGDYHSNGVVHVLEYLSKSLRHVTRSTFSSELHAACDAADLGILIALMMHETETGAVTCAQARQLRDCGGYKIPMCLCVDAMSVFAAITATFVKHPAEKGLLSHVQFVRELLDNHVLSALLWIDTRDMLADGLTKGAVDRADLHAIMRGELTFRHEFKLWQSKQQSSTQQLLESAPRE